MAESDIIAAIKPVIAIFEKLGVQYFIGGSVASSAYGIARATMDVDLVSNLRTVHVSSLIDALKSAFYISETAVRAAIQSQTSFNLIHLNTMLKVDVFILKNTTYDHTAFSRKSQNILDEQNALFFFLGSKEDIILSKLNWFRLGGGASDQQWKDILGILKVQKEHLDKEYLGHWALDLELRDLLQKAFDDAGIKIP